MKFHHILALLASATLAGRISGTVQDLSGGALQGALLANSQEAIQSAITGSWSLGPGTASVSSPDASVPVSRNLLAQGGSLRLSWGGKDPLGRSKAAQTTPVGTLRSARRHGADDTDTLYVFWKGVRMVVLPIPVQDTADVVLRIDTAWSDDRGYAWNPRLEYGSLLDSRDGATYRTVRIGSQTWMAEGLRTVLGEGSGFRRLRDALPTLRPDDRWGVLYFRTGLPPDDACPEGWRLPTLADFATLNANVFRNAPGFGSIADDFESQHRYLGRVLRARGGWSDGARGSDLYGFRLLPSGDHTMSFQDEEGNVLLERRDILTQGRSGAFWVKGVRTEAPEGIGQFRVGDFQDTGYPDLDQAKILPEQYFQGAATIRCVRN